MLARRPAVDVVWGIDNTASGLILDQTEAALNDSFAAVLDQASIDWRVIVIARRGTSGSEFCVPPPLGGDSCLDKPPFSQLDCFTFPRGLLSTIANTYVAANPIYCFGLSNPPPWGQRVRFDALKAIIAVSDEDAGPMPLSFDAKTFDGVMLGLQPAGVFGTALGRNYVFHAIVGTEEGMPPMPCDDGTIVANDVGREYMLLAQATGGLVESICQADYGPSVQRITEAIVARARCERGLPLQPGQFAPALVSVSFTPSGGSPEALARDDTAPCDQGADGWQYNGDQSRLVLCGPTCDRVDADGAGELKVTFACPPDDGG